MWEETMINMLKDRLAKAKIGSKIAKRKLINSVEQVIRGTNNLSELDSELQHAIKEAADWLATKGIDILYVLNTEKNAKV
jgi:hypothetical protein